MPRRRLLAATVAVACLAGAAAAWAAFSRTTSNGSNSATAQRVFAGTRSTSAWTVSDQADGTAAASSDVLSYAGDALSGTSGAFGSAFSATRYFDVVFGSPLPNAIPTSSVTANLDIRPSTGTDTVCVYVEVRRTSTNAVIGTHGSSAAPVACVTGTSFTSVPIALAEVSDSTVANDVYLRAFVKNSGLRGVTVDRATVTGTIGRSSGYGTFTLYESKAVDSSSGTATNSPWPLATTDTTATTYSPWTTAFGASRYVRFSFPSDHVPSGATIASVTLTFVYRSSSNNRSSCIYYEAYNGATLLGSHGSTAASFSCDDSANNWKTDTVTLSEVTTAADVNGLVVRVYGRDTGSNGSLVDRVGLAVNYSLG